MRKNKHSYRRARLYEESVAHNELQPAWSEFLGAYRTLKKAADKLLVQAGKTKMSYDSMQYNDIDAEAVRDFYYDLRKLVVGISGNSDLVIDASVSARALGLSGEMFN